MDKKKKILATIISILFTTFLIIGYSITYNACKNIEYNDQALLKEEMVKSEK